MPSFEKILIVKPSSLGDVVHALAFLDAFKKKHPDTSVHWVIAKGLENILERHPMIDKLWIIEKDKWKRPSRFFQTLKELRGLFQALKRERFDLVIDLQGLLRSGIISWFTRATAIVGFEEAREGSRYFYTKRIKGGRDIHAVDRYLKVAGYFGCTITDPQFPLPPSMYEGRRGLPEKYAVIVPGARWKTKRWPPERFGEVASRLPIPSVILGGGADTDIAELVVGHSGGKAVSFAGKTSLSELVHIIRGAFFMLTNDTGPMHIAAALNIPVAAIFGPTDPRRTGPYGNNNIIIKSEIKCAPCLKKKCGTIECMEGISVDTVYASVKPYIAG